MVDPLPNLLSLRNSYKKLDKVKKSHIKLSGIILIAIMGLIFYFSPQGDVYAQKPDIEIALTSEIIDPLHKIGKGIERERKENFSKNGILEKKEVLDNPKFTEMLEGFPMEKMIPALSARSLEVSSYLIAIAKKESDWGKHSPKKAGHECYNYWGYKGAYRPTASGYSCFDSPEHAISVVGDRIENLLNKKINTPAKFVVWKCGSDCSSAGGQASANEWIRDVTMYFNKLNKS
jgi:hypothetical protein